MNHRLLAGCAMAAALFAGCGGTPTSAPSPSSVGVPAPTSASTSQTAPVPATPAAAKRAICAIWATLAPRLDADAASHRNDLLYTDTAQSANSANEPYNVAVDDSTNAAAGLSHDLQNVAQVVSSGTGQPSSFTADQAAVDKVTADCGPTTAAVTPTVPATTAVPPLTTTPATVASPPLTSPSGNLYRAGEFCPTADLGVTTTGSDGQITCEADNGYNRWIST